MTLHEVVLQVYCTVRDC